MKCPTCPFLAADFPCNGEGGRCASATGRPIAPEPPGLVQKAGNLARAVVAHVADGLTHASPEVQAEREAICRACPNLDQQRDVCNLCGCLAMKFKRSWSSSACPDVPPRWEAMP